MPGSFSIFSPLMLSALVIWIVAALSIRFDLYRMHRELPQVGHSPWYARPILWFAATGVSLGLALATLATPLNYRISWLIALGFALLSTLFFIGAIIVALERPVSEHDPSVEEARLRHLAASNPGSIAKTSIIANQFIVMIIVYPILMLASILSVFILENILLLAIVWLSLLSALIIWAFVLRHLNKHLNRRRRALVSEKAWPLRVEKLSPARPEPVSSEPLQMLTSPLILRLKWWVISGYLITMAAYVLAWLFHTANPILTIFQNLIYLCIFAIPLLRGPRESVEATSEGLIVSQGVWIFRHRKYRQHMHWENARLFACYQTPGFLGGRATMTYELSNFWQIVRWTHLIDTHSPFTLWKIDGSAEEYNQRTQALCACITEPTGLQLHDVSEERLKQHEQEIMVAQSQSRH